MTAPFKTEAELCAAFITAATKSGEWIAYPETCNFDIVLRRVADGCQIGVEAKLVLNAKVLDQALTGSAGWGSYGVTGPDYRAALVPAGKSGSLDGVCRRLGVTVITMRTAPDHSYAGHEEFHPSLPRSPGSPRYYGYDNDWHDFVPVHRLKLPDYIPDVAAGMSAPMALTTWKVAAIKLAILLEERPISRADFKILGLSPSRWTDPYSKWLIPHPTLKAYIPGPKLPDFKAQHPRNYEEIRADREKWDPGAKTTPLLAREGLLI